MCSSPGVYGAELLSDTITTEKAKVLEVLNEENRIIAGTDVVGIVQTLEIQIIDGKEKGKILTLENDYNRYEVGDIFFLYHSIRAEDGFEYYVVSDSYRIPTLLFFTLLFVALVIFIGGVQGVRGLLSLIGSIALILFVLLPSVTAGYSPIIVSIVVSSFIIILGSYITHGFNKTTSAAVIGMIITVIITGILAHVAVDFGNFTGFESEEAVYLNFNFRGNIDIVGILLGGIMIGLLGVLYDVAIGQAISVEELRDIAPHISKFVVYKRAIRMGREHIGALVNTLAIAYVGASLPLLLLFQSSSTDIIQIINKEMFATEIIRTLVGSIGLVLAVPITTFIAVVMLFGKKKKADRDTLNKEALSLEHHKHSHSH